jgi:hypothetical protein
MSTAYPFVPSFYPIKQRPANVASVQQPEPVISNHLLASQTGTVSSKPKSIDVSKHLITGATTSSMQPQPKADASKAMLSISPISTQASKPTGVVYPTQQLAALKEPATMKEEAATLLGGQATMPPPSLSILANGSDLVKNLSTQFEDTPMPHSLKSLATFSAKAELGIGSKESDDLTKVLQASYDSYSFFAPDGTPMKDDFATDGGDDLIFDCVNVTGGAAAAAIDPELFAADGVPIKQETPDLDANLLDATYYNAVPTFAFEGVPTETNAIDASKLDEFSLHSNGSFDLETFPSMETEASIPDPKGILAAKSLARMQSRTMTNRPNTNKPKRKKSAGRKASRASTECSTAVALKPTNKDILRGRGGMTNRHPGNMRFRDEARKLRSEYRDLDTSRREKYLLSQRLVDIVKGYGGRFLEKGDDGSWYFMTAKAERKKASQGKQCVFTSYMSCYNQSDLT